MLKPILSELRSIETPTFSTDFPISLIISPVMIAANAPNLMGGEIARWRGSMYINIPIAPVFIVQLTQVWASWIAFSFSSRGAARSGTRIGGRLEATPESMATSNNTSCQPAVMPTNSLSLSLSLTNDADGVVGGRRAPSERRKPSDTSLRLGKVQVSWSV